MVTVVRDKQLSFTEHEGASVNGMARVKQPVAARSTRVVVTYV